VSIIGVSRTGPPPPLIGKRIARGSLQLEVADALRNCGVAYVHGTSGTGKTTQAALFAHGDREAFLWVNCRDAEEDQLRSQLDEVGRRVDAEPRYRYVVADDVEGVRHGRPLEELLPGLLYTLRHRNGGLVLTGDRPLSQRLSNVLSLTVGSAIAVRLFTEAEVRLLLREYGATESERLDVWARLILAKTSGHPQLVAAYISALAQSGFADPTIEDLLGTPTEIASAREEARLVLANTLSPAHRDLLYRLSLLTGPFARNRALALAEVDPTLPEPGDLFDLLVGPWIERVTDKEYRLSPLLLNAGSRANSETWTKSTYAAIASTWTRFREQTPWDISTILFSATLGGNTQAIARLAMGLTSAKNEVWDALGEADVVFVHCYTRAGQTFPGTSLEVFYARWVQLQLSARGNAKTYLAILDRIEESFPQSATDPKLRVLRHMLLLQSIMSPVDALPIRRLIRIITDVEESWQLILEELRRAAERSGARSKAAKLRTLSDVPNVLSVTLLRRVKNCDELTELVPALDEMEPQLRSRCLALFREHPDMGRQLADAVWLSEYQSAAPRWDSLVKSLQQPFEAAVRWSELTLAQALSSVLARTLHEQLSESQRALEVLAAAPRGGMGAYLVESEQAKILSQTGDATRAIALWSEALAGAHADPNANVVGTALVARNAAIAASNTGDWSRAAEFAETAVTAARGAADARLVVGIIADASHAQWRARNSARSVTLMAEALERLGTVPNSPKDVRDYYANKAVGHLVTWMAGQAKSENSRLPEPSFGSCSYLEPSERILDVNPTPLEFSQAGLIAIARSAGVPLQEFAALLQRLRVAPYASVRFRVVESELAEAMATGNVARVVDLVATLIAALIASREERDGGKPLWVPKPETELDSLVNAQEWLAPDFWILQLCNALLALAAAGSPIGSGISTWHAQAQSVRAPAAVCEWIRFVEQLAGRDGRAWLAALRSSSGHWSGRIVAAALILDGESPDARLILEAHATLLELHEWALASQFEAGVCRALSHAWREEATKRPFALRAPRVHVPFILEACDSVGISWTKAAKIFLAAAAAVDLRVPELIVSRVRQLAGEPQSDSYARR
jgi:tetratricopeptide (TPR) repeat protein